MPGGAAIAATEQRETVKVSVSKALVVTLPTLILAGCGLGSHVGPDASEFRYKPPASVSDDDRQACTSRARSAAFAESSKIANTKGLETATLLLGPIFTLGVFSHIYEAEEDAYETEFKECLKEKGYPTS